METQKPNPLAQLPSNKYHKPTHTAETVPKHHHISAPCSHAVIAAQLVMLSKRLSNSHDCLYACLPLDKRFRPTVLIQSRHHPSIASPSPNPRSKTTANDSPILFGASMIYCSKTYQPHAPRRTTPLQLHCPYTSNDAPATNACVPKT